LLGTAGLTLLAIAVAAVVWPEVLAWPLALIAAWVGIVMLERARRLRRGRKSDGS